MMGIKSNVEYVEDSHFIIENDENIIKYTNIDENLVNKNKELMEDLKKIINKHDVMKKTLEEFI